MRTNLSPQKVLQIFQSKFKVLKNVKLKQIDQNMSQKYHGYANFTLDQEVVEMGKTRHRKVHPYQILLNKNLQQNIYVLLHEISHCVSPHVQRKHKDEWIYMQHQRKFYENLYEIIKIANKEGIFQKKFKTVEDLMKYDKTV